MSNINNYVRTNNPDDKSAYSAREVVDAIFQAFGGGGGGSATSANQDTQIAIESSSNALLNSIQNFAGSIDAKTLTVGQKASADSSPVVIASDQSLIPADTTLAIKMNIISFSLIANGVYVVDYNTIFGAGYNNRRSTGGASMSLQIKNITGVTPEIVIQVSNDGVNWITTQGITNVTASGTAVGVTGKIISNGAYTTFNTGSFLYRRFLANATLTGVDISAVFTT